MGAQFRVLTAEHQHQQHHQQQHHPRRVDLGKSSSSWTSSRRTQRNHLLLQQLWPRHQPWWTPRWQTGCTSGCERAGGTRNGPRRAARCLARYELRPTTLGEGAHPGPLQGRSPPHRPPVNRTISRQLRGTLLSSCIECQQRFAAPNLAVRPRPTWPLVSTPPLRRLHVTRMPPFSLEIASSRKTCAPFVASRKTVRTEHESLPVSRITATCPWMMQPRKLRRHL